jgi:hypothetical protein
VNKWQWTHLGDKDESRYLDRLRDWLNAVNAVDFKVVEGKHDVVFALTVEDAPGKAEKEEKYVGLL